MSVKDLGMTGETGLGRREPGESGPFHAGVAKTAIDAQLSGVMPVAEHDRLVGREATRVHHGE